MLHLKRMTHFNEFLKDSFDNILMYGDFYYESDTTGKIISANKYHELKQEKRKDNWDYTMDNFFTNDKEYQEALKEKERELLEKSVLDEPVYSEFIKGGTGVE